MPIAIAISSRTVGEEFAELRADLRAKKLAEHMVERMRHTDVCGRTLRAGPCGEYCPKCGKVFGQ